MVDHYLELYVLSHLDDSHLKVLGEVLSRCVNRIGLSLNGEPELRYLGYVVNQNGLIVDPEKVNAILEIPAPRSVSNYRDGVVVYPTLAMKKTPEV